ncbi:hypothetical protein FO519_003757 [Halicephalobus sp. NKZ332]|nr:hypothetical protein FO519_003757 [Halicephalobus sp. NKZ332]
MSIVDRLLQNPKVKIKDPASVKNKIQRIITDSYDKLLVISDFDYTLSRFKDEKGVRCLTTHAIFDDCTPKDSDLSQKLKVLSKKYIPIEFDPHMSVEEKIPHMEAWWGISHDYIVESKFTYKDIEELVAAARVYLRDAATEFVRSVEAHNVPLILFSAGIGNIIEIVLKRNLGHVPQTLHVISNTMHFNEGTVCVGFSKPIIHTFCKNSSVITGERPFFHHIRTRNNVLLIGDSLGDIHMDVGIENEGVALKIGFLNFDFDRLMDKYLDVYDIVLVDYQSMEVPLEIFRFCGIVHSQSQTVLTDYCHVTEADKTQADEELSKSPSASVIA